MSPDVALGFWFARAVLARDIDESDRLRAEILKRWGPRSLISLAFTISASRVFPTVKYALGHGRPKCALPGPTPRSPIAPRTPDLCRAFHPRRKPRCASHGSNE